MLPLSLPTGKPRVVETYPGQSTGAEHPLLARMKDPTKTGAIQGFAGAKKTFDDDSD